MFYINIIKYNIMFNILLCLITFNYLRQQKCTLKITVVFWWYDKKKQFQESPAKWILMSFWRKYETIYNNSSFITWVCWLIADLYLLHLSFIHYLNMWFIGVYHAAARAYESLLNIYCSIKKNARKELRMTYPAILFQKKHGSCTCASI